MTARVLQRDAKQEMGMGIPPEENGDDKRDRLMDHCIGCLFTSAVEGVDHGDQDPEDDSFGDLLPEDPLLLRLPGFFVT